MSREKSSAVEGLVTSDAVQAGARLRKRLMIGGIVLVVLVGFGVGGWYVWKYTGLLRTPAAEKTKTDYSHLSPEAAIQAAQEELKAATTTKEKVTAYSNLGQAYMRNNQPSQAVTAYEQAVQQSGGGSGSTGTSSTAIEDVPNLSALAAAYTAAGDDAKAIKTLQQIITILKASNDPNKNRAIARYEADLQYLQGAH